LALVFQFWFPAFPQNQQPNWHTQAWAVTEGFLQNSIIDIAKSKSGFLFLATEAGLVRFDGLFFKGVKMDSFQRFSGRYIFNARSTVADNEGNVWIGTSTDGFAKYALPVELGV